MKYFLQRLVLKWLYETRALEFRTYRTNGHWEQVTEVYFFGEKVSSDRWSELDLIKD